MDTDQGEFFLVFANFTRGALVVSLVDRVPGEAYLRGDSTPRDPIRFRREEGTKPMDLIQGSDPAYYLLSPAAVAAISSLELSGIRFYPVEIDPKGVSGSVSGYQGMAVIGRCGPIQRHRARDGSRVTAIGKTVPAKLGVYFERSTWDGSDFFMSSDGYGFVIATLRARSAIEKANLTNFRFMPTADFVWR